MLYASNFSDEERQRLNNLLGIAYLLVTETNPQILISHFTEHSFTMRECPDLTRAAYFNNIYAQMFSRVYCIF